MIKYGFFNGNEKYYSEDFNSVFDSLITGGLLTRLSFYVNYDDDKRVYVDPGMAFINDVWIYSDAKYYLTDINPYEDVSIEKYRIRYAIALVVDRECKRVTFEAIKGPVVVSGNPYIDPEIPEDGKLYCLLAYVNIDSDGFPQIADLRGTGYCPYCYNGTYHWMNLDIMFDQYRKEYYEMTKDYTVDDVTLARYRSQHTQQLNQSTSEFNTWFEATKIEVQEWLDSLEDHKLTPEQVEDFLQQLATIRNTYVLKTAVNNNIFDLNNPNTIPTSHVVYRAFEQQKPVNSTVNITLEDSVLFGKQIHVTGPDTDEYITSDNTGHAVFRTPKLGAFTFTINY